MLSLPLFFQQTTLLHVDDDSLFLKAVKLTLSSSMHLQSMNNPIDCLTHFKTYTPPSKKISLLSATLEENHIGINFSALTDMQENKKLMNELTVMLVDYNMPQMRGVELCEKLKHFPIKKILITGEADQAEAVRAFNNGLIDRYIRKDNPLLSQEIVRHTEELTEKYFNEQSKSVLEHLEADKPTALSDPIFITFFKHWLKENNIISYTLIDKNGSMRLCDKHQQVITFILHTDDTLADFLKLNDDVDEARPFLERIEKREEIPFFGVEGACWHHEPDAWQRFFHQAAVLEGREKYYWAVVRT